LWALEFVREYGHKSKRLLFVARAIGRALMLALGIAR